MNFLEAYDLHGTDRLINSEMDRCRATAIPRQARHLDRPRAMVPFVGFDPTEKSWRGK